LQLQLLQLLQYCRWVVASLESVFPDVATGLHTSCVEQHANALLIGSEVSNLLHLAVTSIIL
jgi:hypothetical protein